MRCALLPCNIDVRFDPKRFSFSDWKYGVMYYFSLPNGNIFELGTKINDSGVPVECSFCRMTYSREYEKTFEKVMALEEIPWLKLPVIIREKIWQTLTGQERHFEYDEDEANFVYYGENQDFIWAATHCIISIDVTLKIADKLGKRYAKYRRISYKEIYRLQGSEGKEVTYIIDDETIVIIREMSTGVSFKIRSYMAYSREIKGREQFVTYLVHATNIPIEIVKLLNVQGKAKAVEFLESIKARKPDFGEQLKLMGAGKDFYYFDYFANLRDLRVVLGEDILKGFTFELKNDPLKLINYLIS